MRIPLMNVSESNRLVWAANTHGNYSVKFPYNCIRDWESAEVQGGSGIEDNHVWRRLWKLQILPREAHFIWRVLKKIFSVRSKLWTRGVPMDPCCSRCESGVETMDHAFWDCDWSR